MTGNPPTYPASRGIFSHASRANDDCADRDKPCKLQPLPFPTTTAGTKRHPAQPERNEKEAKRVSNIIIGMGNIFSPFFSLGLPCTRNPEESVRTTFLDENVKTENAAKYSDCGNVVFVFRYRIAGNLRLFLFDGFAGGNFVKGERVRLQFVKESLLVDTRKGKSKTTISENSTLFFLFEVSRKSERKFSIIFYLPR